MELLGKSARKFGSESRNSISTMLQRGWKLYGGQGVESNLIDRVYTQTMLYEPSEHTEGEKDV